MKAVESAVKLVRNRLLRSPNDLCDLCAAEPLCFQGKEGLSSSHSNTSAARTEARSSTAIWCSNTPGLPRHNWCRLVERFSSLFGYPLECWRDKLRAVRSIQLRSGARASNE